MPNPVIATEEVNPIAVVQAQIDALDEACELHCGYDSTGWPLLADYSFMTAIALQR